jgi:hypothetical protein
LAKSAAPKLEGMPPDHKSGDCALAGVPTIYLMPGLFWNTHDNHTVWPDVTVTGLVSVTVCHPADELIPVDDVTPNRDEGEPDASE